LNSPVPRARTNNEDIWLSRLFGWCPDLIFGVFFGSFDFSSTNEEGGLLHCPNAPRRGKKRW
jgi:hypothetical protein